MPLNTTSLDAVLIKTPKVSTIDPVDAAVGVEIGKNIVLNFNTAIDPDSVTAGHLVVSQTASKVAPTGPGLFRELLTGKLIDQDLLSTPVFQGNIEGDITFDADFDQVTFNPKELLLANQKYTVLVSNEIVSKTLTVPAAAGGNTGNGRLTVKGPYTGTWAPETYTVEITTGGALLTGKFKWKKSSDNVWTENVTLQRNHKVDNGITLVFDVGVYDAGDIFTFDATQGIALDAITTFTFTTGSPTTKTPSVQKESNEVILEDVGGITKLTSTPTVAGVGLKVMSIDPPMRSSDLGLTSKTITIIFNKDLDPSTINDDSVQVLMETLGVSHGTRKSEPLSKRMTVSGKKLTITVDG